MFSLPVHPLTGLRAIGIVGGKPVWPVMGAEDNPPADPPADPPATPPADNGYPANTPLAEMSAEQQVAYWKAQSRKHENTAKARADYDELREKASQYDALVAASQTDQERAVAAARQEARAEAIQSVAPRLVSAEFRAAAKGVLTAEQVTTLLEDLDLSKYLTDKGEVDVERIEKKVLAFAPTDGGKSGGAPDLGQGRRNPATVSGREAGLAEAQKRFGKPADK